MRQFWAEKGQHSAVRAIRRSKDPTLFTVLAEDTAALIGLVIALAGVALSHILEMPSLDGWASVGIGLVLVGMAVFLMVETHGLLIGEAADPEIVAAITELARAEPGVLHINEVLTQHLGPSDILVNLSIDMADDLSAGDVESLVTRLDRALKARSPDVTRVSSRSSTTATTRCGGRPERDSLGPRPAGLASEAAKPDRGVDPASSRGDASDGGRSSIRARRVGPLAGTAMRTCGAPDLVAEIAALATTHVIARGALRPLCPLGRGSGSPGSSR